MENNFVVRDSTENKTYQGTTFHHFDVVYGAFTREEAKKFLKKVVKGYRLEFPNAEIWIDKKSDGEFARIEFYAEKNLHKFISYHEIWVCELTKEFKPYVSV